MNKKLGVMLLLALAGSAACASELNTQGPYIGVSLGRADGSAEVYRTKSRPSFGFHLGYRFNQNVAAEVFGHSLSFEIFPSWFGKPYEYPKEHVGVAVIGSLPMSTDLSLTARLGLGRTTMERSKDLRTAGHRNSVSGGLGLSYTISPSFALNLGYARYSKVDAGVFSLGGELRF